MVYCSYQVPTSYFILINMLPTYFWLKCWRVYMVFYYLPQILSTGNCHAPPWTWGRGRTLWFRGRLPGRCIHRNMSGIQISYISGTLHFFYHPLFHPILSYTHFKHIHNTSTTSITGFVCINSV